MILESLFVFVFVIVIVIVIGFVAGIEHDPPDFHRQR